MKLQLPSSNVRANKHVRLAVMAALALWIAALGYPAKAAGQILYNFKAKPDGNYPYGGVVADAAGNLYGTTGEGGNAGQGTAFELSPSTGGVWTEAVLYNFQGYPDAGNPESPLIPDASGNLYGTSFFGGTGVGGGTVFKLSPSGSGSWIETILHSFQGGTDGESPTGGLVFDTAGNLYGTTTGGGNQFCLNGCGTVFKLSPTGSSWSETVLYEFAGGVAGRNPYRGLVIDAAGNLFGVVPIGGTGCSPNGCGLVFELSPGAGGVWTETVVYQFNGGLDGDGPSSDLTMDAAGNLYGTTDNGGGSSTCLSGCGTAFELVRGSGGLWTEQIMYRFTGGAIDGSTPSSGALALDSAGNLYGTAVGGGAHGLGTLFKLSPKTGGGWTAVFRSINGESLAYPTGVILGPSGNLFGTFIDGGPKSNGSVFEARK